MKKYWLYFILGGIALLVVGFFLFPNEKDAQLAAAREAKRMKAETPTENGEDQTTS